MIFDYDKYFCSGCQKEVPRHHRCGPTFREQIDELRSRLQALEQNTVPSGSAKQKPLVARKAREWYLASHDGADYAPAYRSPGEAEDACAASVGYPQVIRVREVLDD